MMNIFAGQFQKGFASGLSQKAETMDETNQAKKEKYLQLMKQSLEQYFKKFKAALVEEIPFSEIIDNVYIPVYSKYFTISEIEEITAFYESKVGQKFVSVTPTVMQQFTETFNKKYLAKIMEMSKRIADEVRPSFD